MGVFSIVVDFDGAFAVLQEFFAFSNPEERSSVDV